MQIYVDTENVQNRWVSLLKFMRPCDTMHLFYSINTCKMDIEQMIEVSNCSGKLEIHKCCVGTNAMDFQLSTFLGMEVSRKPKSQHRIFSCDKGFSAVCSFWKNEGKDVAYFNVCEVLKLDAGKSKVKLALENALLMDCFSLDDCITIGTEGLNSRQLDSLLARFSREMQDFGYGNVEGNSKKLIQAVHDGSTVEWFKSISGMKNSNHLREIITKYYTVISTFTRR